MEGRDEPHTGKGEGEGSSRVRGGGDGVVVEPLDVAVMGPIPGIRIREQSALVVINLIVDSLSRDQRHFECDEDGWMADKGTRIVETKDGDGGTREREGGGWRRSGNPTDLCVTPWRFYDTRCDRDGQTR